MSTLLFASLPQNGSIVSRWLLTEAVTGNRADSVGSNTLTDTGSTPAGTGYVNSASDINYIKGAHPAAASTQYLSIANGSQTGLNITGNMTVSCWVNLDDVSADHAILSKWQEDSNQRGYLGHMSHADGTKWEFNVSGDGTNVILVSSSTLATTGFVHVVWKYTPSTSLKVYLNGALDNTNTTSIPASLHSSTTSFVVGSQSIVSHNYELLSGVVNDLIIWNALLSDSDITALYNSYAGASPVQSGLTHYRPRLRTPGTVSV